MKTKLIERAYAAGLMDIRGHLGVHENGEGRWVAQATLNSAAPSVIDWMQARWPARTYSWSREREGGNRLPKHRWQLTQREDVAAFILQIRPYLVFKAEQADLLLDAIEAMDEGGSHAEMLQFQADLQGARASRLV